MVSAMDQVLPDWLKYVYKNARGRLRAGANPYRDPAGVTPLTYSIPDLQHMPDTGGLGGEDHRVWVDQ